MPLILRTVRQNRWYKETAAPFLENDDVPADPLADFNTTENLISVWILADDRSNLERVVRAVAVGRDRIDNAGYVVFSSNAIEDAGIEVLGNNGDSPDTEANVWHRDLSLSGNKIVALVKAILQNGESGQILKKRMRELVEEGIQRGELPATLQKKLEKK